MFRGKKYQDALKLVEKKAYPFDEAIALAKKTNVVKFDASIDLSLHLNVDAKQADQQIRGTMVLPHGNGKTKRVLVVTNTKTEDAKAAGADFVGGKEALERIQKENWFAFDVIVATPEMMGELGKMGKLLGPKGLMPNPKTGTVTMDVTKAINDIKAGKVEYRVDKESNMHVSFARVSFDDQKILENLTALLEAITKARPAAIKGQLIKNAVIHTSMGPSIKIAV
ncbi:MAG: 50S ribosomal protein L1 [Erysipelotrichaceae bacterium]|jgi:large subunit ribosomal protein L1|nr:50S ribosomal protein L1 [Erysipelotrichaceae bacterium]